MDGMTKIKALAERFYKLHDKIGRSKMSSGCTTLKWFYDPGMDYDCHFEIDLGAYDIGDWDRHTVIGPFKTLDDAVIGLEKRVVEAEEYAKNWKREDSGW